MAGERDESGLIAMHRKLAARLLREGTPGRAFGELVRASRLGPMTPRLAALLAAVSFKAGTEPAAITLLTGGIEETEGAERRAIRRQLVRLLRRVGQWERAQEQLVQVLAEDVTDRRARAVLHALLERQERWEELEASLERQGKDALRRGHRRRAARAALARARLCEERLRSPGRAALRYGQAAQLTEEAQDWVGAFDLRLLELRALRNSSAPAAALQTAARAFEGVAQKLGKRERARTILAELGLGAAEAPSRRKTQLELVSAAEEAQAHGRSPVASALLSAAVNEQSDQATRQKLESHLVARGAWRDLALYYRQMAEAAPKLESKVDALSKLAELLENELHDIAEAARVYGQIVELTGDKRALDDQVRLLAGKDDLSGVQRALNDAVSRAPDPPTRVRALVARAEAAFARRDAAQAQADFAHALRVDPRCLPALVGLAEVTAVQKAEPVPVARLWEALQAMPKRQPGRADLFRRLARLAEAAPGQERVRRSAWSEVLTEAPEDEEAQAQLEALGKQSGNPVEVEKALRAQLRREPRGPKTRQARMDLVALLEQSGRRDVALTELRQAVRFEPGHAQAWLKLADRCIESSSHGEAAWALEQAATSTPDPQQRQLLWKRLARFTREALNDPAKAAVYARRAEKMEASAPILLTPASPTTPSPPRDDPGEERVPTRPGSPTDSQTPARAATPSGTDENLAFPSGEFPPAPARSVPIARPDAGETEADVMEITTGDVEVLHTPAEFPSWDAPPGKGMSGRYKTQEVPIGPEAEEPEVEVTPQLPGRALHLRSDLFEAVRADPLKASAYRSLADHFEEEGDVARSALLAEIAEAVHGDANAAPLAPRLSLGVNDRAGLRHPSLRNEPGELLALAGVGLCRLFPARGRAAGSRREFRPDAGRGAQAAADALLQTVRILGLRAPEVFVSEENGPPFSMVYVNGPRILVGRLAMKKALPESELRFFAGRALFTQIPDLLCLRTLKKEQLQRGLSVLGSVLRGGGTLSPEARALRDELAPKSLPRMAELYERWSRKMRLGELAEGARHAANRAGLVVCGGVAPACAALKAKKALKNETVELIRFAASERYLQLRNRRAG